MKSWLYPVVVWLVLLVIVFAAEYGVMLLLPWLVPQRHSRLLEAVVDAVVLVLLLAPVLWLMLVRPLREVIRLRTQFLADLFAQVEIERRQTAGELHDGVGQKLTLLISGLRSAKSCRANEDSTGRDNGFQRLAEDALAEVRRLCLGLRPSLLDDLGLAPALERLIEDVRAHHSIAVTLDIGGLTGKLPEGVATAAFRIVQEALANVVKHSQARAAAVTVRRAGGDLLVEVVDDGRGIAPAVLRTPPAGHLGLRGMRERAALMGGVCEIESAAGRGACIRVRLPAEGVGGG